MTKLFANSEFAAEVSVACDAVRLAARVCRTVQAGIRPEALEKKDRSPVTIADFASQALVCRALHAAFPQDPVIGEEDARELRGGKTADFLQQIVAEISAVGVSGTGEEVCDWIDRGYTSDYQPRFWTLDPIDGTKGFLRGQQYAISLALIIEGRIEVGLLGCPNLSPRQDDAEAKADASGALFVSVRGAGTVVLPLDSQEAQPRSVRVRDIADPAAARLCESVESGHSSHGRSAEIARKLGITRDPIRLDSQAKYATVADGRADIYLRLPTRQDYVEKIWDHAGGVLVIEEAGGRVTDIDGKPLDFTHGRGLTENRGVVATGGQLHEAVLAAVREAG